MRIAYFHHWSVYRHTLGRSAVIERDKTATIYPSLPWEPWQNVANRDKTHSNRETTVIKRVLNATERDKTWKDREMPGDKMLPVPLRSASKFYYGLLRTVTFCCVHPVLLRPARFLIRTVAAVADFLTV